MLATFNINKKIAPFNKLITIDGDKSLSIRWALLASQAIGTSKAYKLLQSEDVLNTLKCLKKLGIKIKLKNDYCEIIGRGLNGYKYKDNLSLDAGNSGTLGRLILGLLVHAKKKIKLTGDRSLSKRDFSRVTEPLSKFNAKFYFKKKNKLPLSILGSKFVKPINYHEDKGSAQCKSSVMLAALNTSGETNIRAKNICKANKLKKKIDVSAAYLVNRYNCSEIEILKFINDFRSAGCNLLRFTFAQPPRGKVDQNLDTVPNKQECEDYTRLLEKIVKNEDSDECKILFVDADKENDFFRKPRTLPCVARFIYPTVGFDGKLYHCSQSAAPNFKEIELGNLANNSFRDLYYNYDVSDFKNYFINLGKKMNKVGCRCDRKEHTVNTKIQKSNFLK